jgi:hypothetical protein
MAAIPAFLIRDQNIAFLGCTMGGGDINDNAEPNYQVLTSYVNTRNGELRLDKHGHLYVLKPICCIFQSVIHWFIKWFREGWNGDATHSWRLERSVQSALKTNWIKPSRMCLDAFAVNVGIVQRAVQAVQWDPLDQGPIQIERQRMAETKVAFVNHFCQSMLATMEIASKIQDIAPSYTPIFRAGDYAELQRELAAGRIPAHHPVLRGFLPADWIPVIEQIVL